MSAKMKRRRRHSRLKRIAAYRRENGLFFAHGAIPASATTATGCSCGGVAFSRSRDPRERGAFHEDFELAHALCS